jgi:hypothetical protein
LQVSMSVTHTDTRPETESRGCACHRTEHASRNSQLKTHMPTCDARRSHVEAALVPIGNRRKGHTRRPAGRVKMLPRPRGRDTRQVDGHPIALSMLGAASHTPLPHRTWHTHVRDRTDCPASRPTAKRLGTPTCVPVTAISRHPITRVSVLCSLSLSEPPHQR